MLIGVLPVEGAAAADIDALEAFVGRHYACATRRLPPLAMPPDAYDEHRSQHDATTLLKAALAVRTADLDRLLVVTDRDIFIPMLTFIFGQAQVDGPAALLSLARLRQEFYGMPARHELMLERARKEIVHELGHTFGLVHCADKQCAMALSINVTNIDIKRDALCGACARNLADRLEAMAG